MDPRKIVHVETLESPTLYGDEQLQVAMSLASFLKKTTEDFGKLILLEPPENA